MFDQASRRTTRLGLFILILGAFLTQPLLAGDKAADDAAAADRAAVRAAVLDYVEGVYDAEPDRIRRSVHPEMAKRGFARRSSDEPYREIPMTFEQLVNLAATYNADGSRVPKDAPKDIVLFEVLDKTATIKLTASWGVDYMHLAKYDGEWKIVNVLWQRLPD